MSVGWDDRMSHKSWRKWDRRRLLKRIKRTNRFTDKVIHRYLVTFEGASGYIEKIRPKKNYYGRYLDKS